MAFHLVSLPDKLCFSTTFCITEIIFFQINEADIRTKDRTGTLTYTANVLPIYLSGLTTDLRLVSQAILWQKNTLLYSHHFLYKEP